MDMKSSTISSKFTAEGTRFIYVKVIQLPWNWSV